MPTENPENPLPPEFSRGKEVLLNAKSLRALAHPVRVKLLGQLRLDGPATATGLAEKLGLNSGATSYHLRQLAESGFIEEDVDRGTGRDRWWRAAHRTTWYDPELAESDDPAAGYAYTRTVGLIAVEQIQASLDEMPTLPERWKHSGTLSDWALRLTPTELDDLVHRINALIQDYRKDYPETREAAPPGAEAVSVQLQAFLRPGTLGV